MIAVIFNPTARGAKAAAFQKQIRSIAPEARLLPTTGPGDATRLAEQAAHEGASTVAAAGGDGTVNEVLNGLVRIPLPHRPSLGILPLGTVNVFAKEIGLPTRLEESWQVVRTGQPTPVDVAVARHPDGIRHFIQMAGAGLDSAAIARVQWKLKKAIGPLAYVWAGLGALRGPLPTIHVTGGPQPLSGQLALIGNGRFYGGRIPVFPDARLADGRLDLALLPRVNPLSLARAAAALNHGRLLSLSGVAHQQSPHFEFTSPQPATFQLEGDNVGQLPVQFSVLPCALRVLTPRPG